MSPAAGPTLLSLRAALRVLAGALVAVSLLELVLLAHGVDAPLWVLALFPAQALVWGGAGLLAWSRRPSNRMGPLLLLGGASHLLAGLGNATLRPLPAVGALVATLPLAVSVHVLLAFPSGTLNGRGARVTTGAGYLVAGVVPLPTLLFTPGSPLAIGDDPALARLGDLVTPLGALVALATAVVLVGRLRRAGAPQRRALRPLYAYGVVSTTSVMLAVQLQALVGWSDITRFVVQMAAVAVVPVAFTAVLLLGGFARAGEVEELGTLLSEDLAPTQDVLARVLGDPTLELLHWLPSEGGWVDSAGRTRVVDGEAGRGLVEVMTGGRRTGALRYDTTLLSDPGLVRAAARPARLALQAERLQVELRRSRARLVEAADEERRRLARDLHDGLQVRLVLLALTAGTLAVSAPDPPTAAALEQLRADVDEAAAELRRTVQALLPAALVERGLRAAVEDLVDRLPLPTRLRLGEVPDDLGQDRATAAWYVVTESLTNALKHAAPSALEIRLGLVEGDLVVEVVDDGSGEAAVERGTGLRGLVDRLDVVDGRLGVHSAPGAGTRVRAEIPVRV